MVYSLTMKNNPVSEKEQGSPWVDHTKSSKHPV